MRQDDIVAPLAPQHTQEVTCTPRWYVQRTEYPPAMATYQPLINGEETFEAVHLAIAQAKKSIDIICWGFQPSMYFIRDGKAPSIGKLLMDKAKNGVEVRILGWEMPFNSAGAGGEANLPGKGTLRINDRAMQSSSEEQYDEDRRWFAECAVSDDKAAQHVALKLPVFVSRGFDVKERAEIEHQVRRARLDPQVSRKTRFTLAATATHHQKTVLVDFELPDRAVGFVMGHNMLDEYWDTNAHSALNRSGANKPAPNMGPRGKTPRQDISSRVSGPILEALHNNFAKAWRKETGENLIASRQSMQLGPQLHCTPDATRQIAQIVRTQAQERKRDIEQLYLQAVNNATQFIYIENQYFRWPPLAELINAVAAGQTKAGRDPGIHGPLHLFVITNASEDSVGPGAVNTQRMLASLGRAEAIPEVTKLQRIEEVKQNATPQPRPEPRDHVGHRELAEWQAELDRQIGVIKDSTIQPEERPGLKVHLCSLVAPDSPAGNWMPVYIHSKLMIVDDVFTTHGSANINTRSMQVDSELNIAHEWESVTEALRRQLWNLHTDGRGAQDDPGEAFKEWQRIINKNKELQDDKITGAPYAPLVEFYYDKATLKDLD
ncbi:phosphatidylserine/phosphatidylglycerophosphate/cardiolipin synthase family protein [Pseudomonas veronii]|uniref:phospholipase D-like domain-containing protein n=1 Tax=Pseudomonas veronii TaxID=76761 RepID=UPI0018E749A3|nr:phosphatidylserine/phosphatidylglycerophosphate/cardiolipin synthase family protein [Pseudomonas veronii]MBJ2180244.1 phosphatidylserine/phosphatidylglycerophosphate/cardiolipin synthase family protein [Pseudomonas veronii]